ncbi:hypothetical protein C0995_015066, partial [Termitomyces sp. Mi166
MSWQFRHHLPNSVVVVTTDPRTPEQYDGLVMTQQKAAAASKGKEKIVPTLSDESNYGESSSEHEQESEEGENSPLRRKIKLRLRLPYNIGQLMISLDAFPTDW